MMRATLAGLTLRSLRTRLLLLGAFAVALLGVALTMRLLTAHEGHVEPGRLFQMGGYPLVSALVLLGWVLGRFPLIATIVLMAGIFSHDRDNGYARFYAARPLPLLRIYGARFLLLAAIAFALGAVLLPLFDIILLGQWAGPGVLVLVAAQVIAFGGLTAFLSLFTRADAWIAALLALLALAWHALRAAGTLDAAPTLARDIISMLLPPHGALAIIEQAFAQFQPVPWMAFLYVAGYGVIWVVIGAMMMGNREV